MSGELNAEDDLRSAMASITNAALPPVRGKFFDSQARARAQQEIMDAVVKLNKAGGLWYRRWRASQDEITTLTAQVERLREALGVIAEVDDDGYTSDGHERCQEWALRTLAPQS